MHDRRTILLVSGLTVLAAALRLIALNGGLWYDEIATLVRFARLPFAEIVTTFPTNNNHPLYSVLSHASVACFGEQPWTLRLPAVLFGTASIPMLFLLGGAVTTRREALLSSALLAVSYHHVWFSQNARGYSALAFCAITSTLLFWKGMEQGRLRLFVAYGIVSALGVYTHLTMVFVVLTHAVVAVLVPPPPDPGVTVNRWTPLVGFVLAGCISVVLYAPLVPQLWQFFAVSDHRTPEVAGKSGALLEALRGLRIGMGTVGVGLAGGLSLWGLWSYLRDSRSLAALFVLPPILMSAGTVLARRPIFPRFFFFLIGFAALLIVRGATVAGETLARWASPAENAASGQRIGSLLVGGLLVVSAASLPHSYSVPKQDFEGAMTFVQSVQAVNDRVATVGAAAYPYRQYYRMPWDVLERADQLDSIRRAGHRVWLLYTFPAYIEVETPDLMASIRHDCRPIRAFPGTVGNGDVVVCRFDAIPAVTR